MTRRLFGLLLPLVAAALSPTAAHAAGDPVKGKTVFARCMACHKVDKSGTNGMGPNLYGVVGRPIGSAKGFTYSPAMAKKGGKWTPAQLDAYLAAPAKVIPGNKMLFFGLPDAGDRADLIAYLASVK